MKAKAILMTAIATMAMATSAFAAVPSGYDTWVNVEKVTATEARNGGYCKEIVKSFAGDIISMPNQDGPSITEEQLEEMMRGN